MLSQLELRTVERAIGKEIVAVTPVYGGNCCSNYCLSIHDGEQLFCKTAPCTDNMFEAEAKGLYELSKSKFCVPMVVYQSEDFLVLQYLQASSATSDYFRAAGKLLAQMHDITADSFGFCANNYIGLTPQENYRTQSWVDFFWTNRLVFQVRLLEQKRILSPAIKQLFRQLESNFCSVLGTVHPVKPSLCHGDLWSGNMMPTTGGMPALFDPAVYYGHNETDLAMAELFGGFPQVFYDAYFAESPMTDGYHRRKHVYQLYHILNHINLFGPSYNAHAEQLLRLAIE